MLRAINFGLYRVLDGVADAAAFGSMLSILMVLYPERAALIVGLTESLFALGYTIGKKSLRFKKYMSF